jgi:hypothetical protein
MYMALIYRKRWLADLLKTVITESAITVLSGARQVSESTLLLNELREPPWQYYNLDNLDALEQMQRDPHLLLQPSSRCIFDEAHRMPKILSL